MSRRGRSTNYYSAYFTSEWSATKGEAKKPRAGTIRSADHAASLWLPMMRRQRAARIAREKARLASYRAACKLVREKARAAAIRPDVKARFNVVLARAMRKPLNALAPVYTPAVEELVTMDVD